MSVKLLKVRKKHSKQFPEVLAEAVLESSNLFQKSNLALVKVMQIQANLKMMLKLFLISFGSNILIVESLLKIELEAIKFLLQLVPHSLIKLF